jgi:hypothetical protein
VVPILSLAKKLSCWPAPLLAVAMLLKNLLQLIFGEFLLDGNLLA